MADTPHSIPRPDRSKHQVNRLSQAKYYGVLLSFLGQKEFPLSEEQVLWIIYYSRKLDESQLLKASRFREQILTDEVFSQRLKWEISKIYHNVPRLSEKRIPEARRIGIGYRDKGALRPLHLKRTIGEESFWGEDLMFLIPQLDLEVDRIFTADEVKRLVGEYHLELALRQLKVNTLASSLSNSLRDNPNSRRS